MLWRPLPYPHPERLMMVWVYNPRQGFDQDVAPYPTFNDWRNQSCSFAHLAALLARTQANRRFTMMI